MILSRLCLNPMHRDTYRFIGDRYRIHQALTACAGMSRQEGGILFRIEDGPVILIQSQVELDWDRLGLAEGALKAAPESKILQINPGVGQEFSFRLLCHPTKKVPVEGKKNSVQRTLRTDEEQIEWLRRKADQNGFHLIQVELTPETWRDTKPASDGDGKRCEVISATRFDGLLKVSDCEKFLAGISKGVGPHKAYGLGMISLAQKI